MSPDREARDTDESDHAPALRTLEEEVLHPTAGRTTSDYADVFSALGHSLRLGAIHTLYENEACTHGDLADALGTDGNGLNHHLDAVVDTPLVRKTPSSEDGRKMIYELTPLGTRLAEYVFELMATEHDAIESEYYDPDWDT